MRINLVRIRVNGREHEVPANQTIAAAVFSIDRSLFRHPPLCGMGICFECRLTIDGIGQQRSCQTLVRDGMEIQT
jgi:sarcosine oxidase subunit alpha